MLWLELRPLESGRAEIVVCGIVSVDGKPVQVVLSGPVEAMRKTIQASAEQLNLAWMDCMPPGSGLMV